MNSKRLSRFQIAGNFAASKAIIARKDDRDGQKCRLLCGGAKRTAGWIQATEFLA
jgi:hypothetical protein